MLYDDSDSLYIPIRLQDATEKQLRNRLYYSLFEADRLAKEGAHADATLYEKDAKRMARELRRRGVSTEVDKDSPCPMCGRIHICDVCAG